MFFHPRKSAKSAVHPIAILRLKKLIAKIEPDRRVEQRTLGGVADTATPRALVAKLNADIARILNQPDGRERLAGVGFDAIGNAPAEFGAYLRAEMAKWAIVIKDSGAKVD